MNRINTVSFNILCFKEKNYNKPYKYYFYYRTVAFSFTHAAKLRINRRRLTSG